MAPSEEMEPSDLALAEASVLQLQKEANLKRLKTSEAIASLIKYVEEHQESDFLVKGFKDPSIRNPYKHPTTVILSNLVLLGLLDRLLD